MAGSGKKSESLDLSEIRERINSIDERLQSLISERATIAKQVGVAKGILDLLSIIIARSERQKFSEMFWSAIRGRCAMMKCCVCFEKLCLRAWRSRNP